MSRGRFGSSGLPRRNCVRYVPLEEAALEAVLDPAQSPEQFLEFLEEQLEFGGLTEDELVLLVRDYCNKSTFISTKD
jgi:hypothetical protein